MCLIDAESLKELFPDNGEGSWTYNATVKAYIDAQPIIELEPCGDTISRQAAIEDVGDGVYTGSKIRRWLKSLPSVQPESTRTFAELVVEYPDPELCTYKEYKGKPYYSIKYIENGETYIGYGTYNPEVLSQYLKEYFILSAQPEPEAVFEWKREFKEYIESLDITNDEWKGIIGYINDVPTVQPETAKRIVGKSRYGITLCYHCDTCNEIVYAQDNYCSGCGRRLIDE